MLKRLFDIIASAVGLIILSPVIAIVAWQIKKKLGSPVLFRQVRPGLHGKPFEMVKFRTMRDAIDANGNPLPDSERMTPFGSFLRSSSLDELPELWNVLKGDMSLVGPRPLLMEYLPLYNSEQKRRHQARPGVTGWAQINGRNAISWEEKFKLDTWYVDNQNLWLEIIFLTIKKVFIRDGISAEGEATMSKFEGTPRPTLAILGASGHGKVVAETGELLGYQCVFFDDAYPEKTNNENWLVIGNSQALLDQSQSFDAIAVAIGNNHVRQEKVNQLLELGAKLPTLIHPSATVSRYANLKDASVIFAGAIVNSSVEVGQACILNTACSIDHDCRLADGVHISPGAHLAGNVAVGQSSWIGIGAAIKQGINIDASCMVGAGAVIIEDVPAGAVVVGNPAKPLQKNS